MDSEEPAEGTQYSLQLRGWYRVFRSIIRFLLRVLSRFEVEGIEHVPKVGPYLLVTNHLHWLDPPVVMAAFPYRSYVFAAEKWERHWFYGPLFRSLDGIFVQRGEVDRKALRKALGVLRGGGVLGLAPEGTRSRSGTMQKGRSGAAYLAIQVGVPVVPVVSTGQEDVFRAVRQLRRARVRVAFGPPFTPAVLLGEDKAGAAGIHAFTEEIMYRLAAMLPPRYRGVYADVAEKRPDLMRLSSPKG